MAVVGGAVLARYMLTASSADDFGGVDTPAQDTSLALADPGCVRGFCGRTVSESSLRILPEDNLAYRDYVVMHEDAEHLLEARYRWRESSPHGPHRMNSAGVPWLRDAPHARCPH